MILNMANSAKIINDSEMKNEKMTSCGKLKVHFADDFREVVVNRIDTGCSTKSHYHNKETQIYLIVEGEGLMKIKNKRTGKVESKNVCSLSTILIPPNHVHQLINIGSSVLVHYEICTPPWREDDELFEEF
ncbi:Glucose-6-phosphate isomerase [uncultured archaeon]|nr:Glucose-6-phosphate isomerase [uncultured archaeon]